MYFTKILIEGIKIEIEKRDRYLKRIDEDVTISGKKYYTSKSKNFVQLEFNTEQTYIV